MSAFYDAAGKSEKKGPLAEFDRLTPFAPVKLQNTLQTIREIAVRKNATSHLLMVNMQLKIFSGESHSVIKSNRMSAQFAAIAERHNKIAEERAVGNISGHALNFFTVNVDGQKP